MLKRITECELPPTGTEPCRPVLEREFDARGRELVLRQYGPQGNIIELTSYAYDEHGTLTSTSTANAAGERVREVTYANTYADGRLRETTARFPDGRELKTVHEPDSGGGHSETVYQNGRYVEKRFFDAANRLIQRFDERSGSWEDTQYDARGNERELTQRFGSEEGSATIAYENRYDEQGRLIEVRMNGQTLRTLTYDERGRLLEELLFQAPQKVLRVRREYWN